jgi:hypothetical protein
VCGALCRRKKKCKQFSLDEKKNARRDRQRDEKGDIARKYGIFPLTLSTILKDMENIKKSSTSDAIGLQRGKKIHTANNNKEVEKAVHSWLVSG